MTSRESSRADLVFSAVLAAVFAYAAFEAFGFPDDARLFPLAVVLPALALALVQIALAAQGRRLASEEPAERDPDELPAAELDRRTLRIAAWIIASFAAVYLLGFLVAIPLLTVIYLRAEAREGWALSVGVAAISWAVVFGLFDRLLHVPLPAGQLLVLAGIG